MTDRVATWYSDCLLRGAASVIADAYPATWTFRVPSLTEPLRVRVAGPVVDASAGIRTITQLITFELVAGETLAPHLAAEAANRFADRLAFTTSKPVDVDLGGVTTAPPGAVGGSYKHIGMGRLVRGESEPGEMSLAALERAAPPLELDEPLSRAMRWLRRSYTTKDIVLMFACLAFGLEALVPLLPISTGGAKATKPSSSNRLKTLALSVCGVPETSWKLVGPTRHQLFHGGLGESEQVRERLVTASGWAEFVLVTGLKNLLHLSTDEQPRPIMPGASMRGVTMAVEGPAEHMRLGGPGNRVETSAGRRPAV